MEDNLNANICYSVRRKLKELLDEEELIIKNSGQKISSKSTLRDIYFEVKANNDDSIWELKGTLRLDIPDDVNENTSLEDTYSFHLKAKVKLRLDEKQYRLVDEVEIIDNTIYVNKRF